MTAIIKAAIAVAGTLSLANIGGDGGSKLRAEKQEMGARLYAERCSSCHGARLSGVRGEGAPALAGEAFRSRWRSRTFDQFYGKILQTMPQDDPGTLSPSEAMALARWIAAANSGVPRSHDLAAERRRTE